MVRMKLGAILTVLSVLMFSAGPMQARGAAPPPQLMDIFQDFSSLEAKFKNNRWEEAVESTNEIASTFRKILPDLKKTVKVDIEKDFFSRLSNLKQSLKKRDVQQTEIKYIELHKMIFALLDNYEFKVPPIISVIDTYIGEAGEAVERDDFKRVVSEMNEVEDFFYQAALDLNERHAQLVDTEEFKSIVRDVREAGRNRDKKRAEAGIDKLRKLSAKFIKLF